MCWVAGYQWVGGATFCGHGYRVWVWLSGGVVCGGVWVGGAGGWDWLGVYFFVWGVGCGFHWGAWGGEVVGAYLGAACFGGGVVGVFWVKWVIVGWSGVLVVRVGVMGALSGLGFSVGCGVLAASAVVVCVRMSWGVVWNGSLAWGCVGVVVWVRVGLTGREAEGPWHEPEKGD